MVERSGSHERQETSFLQTSAHLLGLMLEYHRCILKNIRKNRSSSEEEKELAYKHVACIMQASPSNLATFPMVDGHRTGDLRFSLQGLLNAQGHHSIYVENVALGTTRDPTIRKWIVDLDPRHRNILYSKAVERPLAELREKLNLLLQLNDISAINAVNGAIIELQQIPKRFTPGLPPLVSEEE